MDISFSLNQKSSRNLAKTDNIRRSVQKVPNRDQTLKMATTNNKIESVKESQEKDSSGLLLVGTNKIISLQKEQSLKNNIEDFDQALHNFMGDIFETSNKLKDGMDVVLKERLKVLNQLMIEGKENSEELFMVCLDHYDDLVMNGILSEPYIKIEP